MYFPPDTKEAPSPQESEELARKTALSYGHKSHLAHALLHSTLKDASPESLRGMFDRRALGFQAMSPEAISSSIPLTKKGMPAWFAFLDAYGDVHGNWDHLDGAKKNADALRTRILEENR